jgi:hypothetical protein
VLLKVILTNIGMLQMVGLHPAAAPKQAGPGMGPNGLSRLQHQQHQQHQQQDGIKPALALMSMEDRHAFRTKEVGGKAVAGALLLMLKWFKISRESLEGGGVHAVSRAGASMLTPHNLDIFKFEYLSQLLLDSNYIPLILKLLAHADVPQFVGSNFDQLSLR